MGIPYDEFLAWPSRSQEAALAWQREQADRCPGCGTFAWEWDEDPFAYHAVDFQCVGCANRETRSKYVAEKRPNVPGIHIGLERRRDAVE